MSEVKLQVPQSPGEQLTYWTKWKRDPAPACFVYVVRAVGDPPIKVGIAKNVRHRIASLQTGNPRPIELLALLVGDEALEKFWHYQLRDHRMTGEWFDGPAVPAFIEFAQQMALDMLAAYQTTKLLPDYKDYVAWEKRRTKQRRKPPVAPVKTSFVTPQPLSAEEEVQASLQRREMERTLR
jgi:hypothetical protein